MATGHGPRMSDQLGGSITSEHTHHTAADQAHRFHPFADVFPLMEGDEFDALVADIKNYGLREPIALLGGEIIDGRNRYRACLAAGMKPDFIHLPVVDPIKYVIRANILRRHLTPEKKRELVAKLVKAQPEASNNAIAKQAKVDDKTVAKVRHDMEARSEIPNVEVRTDTKGRKQPAKKHKPVERDRRAATKPERDAERKPREEKRETIRADIERLASRLIELDRDCARALHDVLRADDHRANDIVAALARGLGIESAMSGAPVSAYTSSHARLSTRSSVRKVLHVARTGSGKTVVPVESGQDRKELHK